jgi:hypothetical protein
VFLALMRCSFCTIAFAFLTLLLHFSRIVAFALFALLPCSSCTTTSLFSHYYLYFSRIVVSFFSSCCLCFFLHCYLFLLELLPLFFLRFCLTLFTLLSHSFSIVTLHIIINFQVLISTTLDVDILTLLLFLFPIWFSISPPMCKLEFKHQGSNTKGEFLKKKLSFFL